MKTRGGGGGGSALWGGGGGEVFFLQGGGPEGREATFVWGGYYRRERVGCRRVQLNQVAAGQYLRELELSVGGGDDRARGGCDAVKLQNSCGSARFSAVARAG